MKIKFNWGTGITIGMAAFVIFIVILGIQMFRGAPADYDQQYYEKGLSYDTVYAKEKQVITDKAQPVILVKDNSLLIQFVKASKGNIRFERPSDPGMDKLVPFESDSSNGFVVPLQKFAEGQWRISFNWQSDGKKYLYEREMFLP
jgi:hypothetical protein